MQINIGTPERLIRLILGIVLVVIPFIFGFPLLWTWVCVIVGLVLVVTGALRFCPAWAIFGIDTGGTK